MQSIEPCPFCENKAPIKRSYALERFSGEVPMGIPDWLPGISATLKLSERDKEEKIYYYECRACGNKYEHLKMDVSVMLNLIKEIKSRVTHSIGVIYGKISIEDL